MSERLFEGLNACTILSCFFTSHDMAVLAVNAWRLASD
jgi:hypothetical protein